MKNQTIVKRTVKPLPKEFQQMLEESALISEREAKKLVERYKNGFVDDAELKKGFMRFVIVSAKQFQGQGFSMGELVAFGTDGVLVAAEFYDASKDRYVVRYVVWWVCQVIRYHISRRKLLMPY